MVRRLRDAVAVAEALQAGQSPAQVKKTLRMPPRAADKFVKDVARARRRGAAARAGGDGRPRGRDAAAALGGGLSEDTAAVRAVLAAAA